MVSLGENFNMNSGSSRLFNTVEDDRENLFDQGTFLGATSNSGIFVKIKTIPTISLHLLISVSISLVGVILALKWPTDNRCEAYFILMYLRGAFWLITWAYDVFIKRHHEVIRLMGYHDFYRNVSEYHGLPFLIVSLWNSCILVIQTLMHHLYGPDFGERCIRNLLNPISYITLFTITETIILIIFGASYIVKVRNFNSLQQQPDALQGTPPIGGALGLHLPQAEIHEVLEKQADLINFLKDHNIRLNKRLMQMNNQIQALSAHHT